MVQIQSPDKIILAKKKKDIRVFLDIDGVCGYWEKSVADVCKIDLKDKEIRDKLKNNGNMEDIVGSTNKMWRMIDKEGEKFWEDMEILPWAKRLYDELRKRTKDFCFLSSPSELPECASGKIKWLKKHFGKNFRDFLIGGNKHLCASSSSLLIDDNEKKCKKFEEYGGNSFLWPNLFKLIDKDININDTLKELFDLIEKIKE